MQPIYRTQAPTRPRPTPKPRVWTVWVAFAVAMLGVVGGSLLIAGAVSLYVAADMRRRGLSIAPGELGALVLQRLHGGPVLVASALVSVAVFTALALLGARLSPTPARARLRWNPPSLPRRGVLWGTVGFVAWSMLLGTALHAAGLDRDGSLREIREVFQHAGWASLWGAVIAVGFGPGLAEELFFRGYLQTRLTQRHGARAGVALASVLFGLAHMDKVHTAFAVLAGMYLGWLSLRAKSIVPGVVAHATNNVLSVLLTAFVTEPDDAEYVVPALMIWGGLCAACTVHLMRAPDAKPVAARPSATRGLVTAAAAFLSMLALAVGLKFARPNAIVPPLVAAPIADNNTEGPRPTWDVWPTSVDDLNARLAERTRLRPDQRFVRAFAEVDRLRTGRLGAVPTATFAQGAWTLRRGGDVVATLDEVPGFTNAFDALVSYAAAHRIEGAADVTALPAVPSSDPWATLRALEPQWRAGTRDLRVIAPMARALTTLCVRAVKPGAGADVIFSRALAAVASCRASGHPDAAAEALLATAMWYESDARARAAALPQGDATRAWAEADDSTLTASADPAAPMLRALLVARREGDARLDVLLDGSLATAGGGWRQLLEAQRARLAHDFSAKREFHEGFVARVTEALDAEVRGGAPSAHGVPSRQLAAIVAAAPEEGLVDRALVGAYATTVFDQAWWGTFDFNLDALGSPDGARTFAVTSDQGEVAHVGALRRAGELLTQAQQAGSVAAEIRRTLHSADGVEPEVRARLLGAMDTVTPDGDVGLIAGFDDLRDALDTRPAHRSLFVVALKRPRKDMVAAERWSRLAVEASPTFLWHDAIDRDYMIRDASALSRLAMSRAADWNARRLAVYWLARLPDQDAAVLAGYRAIIADAPDETSPYLDASEYLLDHHDPAAALALVRPWLDAHPSDDTLAGVVMRVRAARVLRELRRFDEAWALIEPTIPSWQYGALVHGGAIAADRGHADVALQLYLRAIERYRASDAIARAMELYWRLNHAELALQLYAQHSNRLGVRSAREDIGPAFVRVFGAQPVDVGRAVIDSMEPLGLLDDERLAIAEVAHRAGHDDLAVELAQTHRQPGLEGIATAVQTWKLMREVRGEERALAWLEARLSRRERLEGLRAMAYTHGAYDLLWSALEPPEDIPQEAETLWLYRAAAYARAGGDVRPELSEFLTQPGTHRFRTIGRFLVGTAQLADVLPLGTTPGHRVEVAYYAGVRAQHDGRLDEASQWFQLVTALGQPREAEDGFAQRQLDAWTTAGHSLSPAHSLTHADAAPPPAAPAAPPPPAAHHGHGAHHGHHDHGAHHSHHH